MIPFEYLILILVIIFSYLLGSINFAVIISKMISGKDIRSEGSGNAGATNMLRTHGKKMGALTLLGDVFKGVLAVLLAKLSASFTDADFYIRLLPLLAGLFVTLGHNFPIFFGFRGGKGVATGLGVILTLNWRVALIVLVVALLVMLITRYVSLGSVTAGILYIAVDLSYMVFTNNFFLPELIFTIVLCGLLVLRHKSNIKRLLNGTEHKLGEKRKEYK